MYALRKLFHSPVESVVSRSLSKQHNPHTRLGRPHVVHIIDELPPDGAERLIVDVLQNRSDRFRYTVLCIVRGGSMVNHIERMGIAVVILGRRAGLDLGTVPALVRWLKQNGVDVVHTHLYAADTYGRLAAALAGVRARFSTRHNTRAWSTHGRRMAARVAGLLSTKVIACGAEVGNFMLEREGLSARRLVVIPNGIDLGRFENADAGALRRELEIDDEEILIGVVGRLHEQKGHADLLNALAALSPDVPPYRCVFVGSGALEDELLRQCRTLGLSARVQFLGQRSDIPNVLAGLDIFVMPSHWEGLPMALLEAMGSGCAVVATRVGEIPNIIRDGDNGRLVRPQNATDLTAALDALLRDTSARQRLGAAARRTVHERFSAAVTAGAYERLYDAALSGTRE